ncbi:MAG: hypothetical protein OQK73_12330 [Gammaproteobacteria bacterium]|nr:hypothetical protein [Gammaproteobacteria bacterium]
MDIDTKFKVAKIAVIIWAVWGLLGSVSLTLYMWAFTLDDSIFSREEGLYLFLFFLGLATVLFIFPLIYLRCLASTQGVAKAFFWFYSALLLLFFPVGTIVGVLAIVARYSLDKESL